MELSELQIRIPLREGTETVKKDAWVAVDDYGYGRPATQEEIQRRGDLKSPVAGRAVADSPKDFVVTRMRYRGW